MTGGTKLAGRDVPSRAPLFSHSGKRAFRRARNRAAASGQTWYRGRLVTARDLQLKWTPVGALTQPTEGMSASAARTDQSPPACVRSRLRVATYNCGGMSSELYDVICDWLTCTADLDIVAFQETHWGLGREEGTWSIPGWSLVASADPNNRYCGVALAISDRVVHRLQITFCTWIPGRLLHVKCEGRSTTLDLICLYQWVRQDKHAERIEAQRAQLWTTLERVLQQLPRRNLLALFGDCNTPVSALPGLVGRGVLASATRSTDEIFLSLLKNNQLVLLNTWSRASARHAATFVNGSVASQIDFIAVRRVAADAPAKCARPVDVNLAPWRNGPRHRMVRGTIPWTAGWRLQQIRTGRQAPKLRFSKHDLQECVRVKRPALQELQQAASEVFRRTNAAEGLTVLNSRLLEVCCRLFPVMQRASYRSDKLRRVQAPIRAMWQAYREFRQFRARARTSTLFAVWRAYARFQLRWRQLRRSSRAERRRWLAMQVEQTHQASLRQDMGEVYRITRLLAPKQRRDSVRIRSPEGHLLGAREQFEAIHGYFATAFGRPDEFVHTPGTADIVLSTHDVVAAIKVLKPRKAVPVESPMAELWRLCPSDAASFFLRVLPPIANGANRLPSQMTDCSLSLLPKPNKSTRLPKDLRPLGLQDPAAKILAGALKDKILTTVLPYMQRFPQYAYTPGKAIDEAVCRAVNRCKLVRSTLQETRTSVHARRRGCKGVRCAGGITLSLDLSRAFDQVPRWCLVQSLKHAGIDGSTVDMVIAIHEQCTYSVTHNSHAGSFPLQVGIRQGCSLSPLLFSLFTCWLCDLLDERICAQWSQQHLTIFADDNLAQWCVQQEADLSQACVQIPVLFALLAEVGMAVNPSKSGMLVRLRGTGAHNWLRQHTRHTKHGTVLNVGTPSQPLEIPIVKCLTYLGVRLSYHSLEAQTCQWRICAAQTVRQRLLKLLHAAGLRRKLRLKLYCACVRSSLVYGQHAVGYNAETLRKLEACDARWVRAIARSPAHLTKESNRELRQRLKLQSVLEAQQKLLRGRLRKTVDADAIRGFKLGLEVLDEWMSERAQLASVGLSAVHTDRPIPCEICGQYLINMRHMLSHRARKHPAEQTLAKPLLQSTDFVSHTIDGMPQCRHCCEVFTRIEALKKHLRRSCPILHAPVLPDSRDLTGDALQCAADTAAIYTSVPASDLVTAASDVPAGPLIERPDFRNQLKQGWKTVLRNAMYRASLSTYCVYCGQWLDTDGMKQHHRLVHADAWAHKTDACSRCNGLGLVVTSPCHYCGRTITCPRTHTRRCPVLFQASIAELTCRHQDAASPGDDGNVRGGLGDYGDRGDARCSRSGARRADLKEWAAGPGRDGGGQREAEQMAETAVPEGQQREGASGMGQLDCASGRVVPGCRAGAGPEKSESADSTGQTRHSPRGRTCQDQDRHDLHVLPGYWRWGDSATGEESCCTVAAKVRGEKGEIAPGDNPAPEHLRGCDHQDPPAARGRNPTSESQRMGMDSGRAQRAGSAVDVLPMEPGGTQAGAQSSSSHQKQRCVDSLGGLAGSSCRARSADTFQGNSTAVKHGSLRQRSLAFYLHAQPAQPNGDTEPCGNRGLGEQLRPEAHWNTHTPSSGRKATLVGPAGEGLSCSSMGGVAREASGLDAGPPVPIQQGGRQSDHAISGSHVRSEVPFTAVSVRTDSVPNLPAALLCNPHNICYLNSVAQAMSWLGMMANAVVHCGGKASAALSLVARKGKPYLPECLPWRAVLRTWSHLSRQQDACVFLTHLLEYACPRALAGQWQARLCNPDLVTDSGPLRMPILLDVRGPTLQDAVTHWHLQYTRHAIAQHGGVVLLQLKRYDHVAGVSRKNSAAITVRPGAIIQMPIFCAEQGIETSAVSFAVIFVIFHIGDTPDVGHYQAALSVPTHPR